jgi:uncharacterized protein YjbJ (UPF0337 family)
VDPRTTTTTTDPIPVPGEPFVDPMVEPDLSTTGAAPPEASQPSTGRAEQLKGAAGDAASTATDDAKRVASAAADQARSVVQEAKDQAASLVGQAQGELRQQADAKSSDAAGSLRTLSDRLQALAEGRPEEAGPLNGYLDEARGRITGLATRLDERGVDGVLSDVSRFAQRRPGLFLIAAAGAGFVAGRLVRSGARAGNGDGSSTDTTTATMSPSDPLIAATPAMIDPPAVSTRVSVP